MSAAQDHPSVLPMPVHAEAGSINARFVKIPVTNVERCDLLIERFTASDIASTGPLRLGEKELHDPSSVVKSVTAVIHFRSPVTVDPQHLIIRTPRSTTPASRTTLVEAGLIDTTGALAASTSGNTVDLRSLSNPSGWHALYTVRVPLIRQKLVQPGQMPLVDRIQTKDKYVMHYTIAIAGVVWPSQQTCEYKVRIKVVQTHPELCQVVSISSSFIDSLRFTEAMQNFKDWVQAGVHSIRHRGETDVHHQPAEQAQLAAAPGDVLVGDQEYYYKLMGEEPTQPTSSSSAEDALRVQPVMTPIVPQATMYYFPTAPLAAQ